MQLLYAVLLFGSPALGLEVLLIGQVNSLSSWYDDDKIKTFLAISLTGLCIIGISIFLNTLLTLNRVYLGALIFVETYLAGRLLRIFNSKKSTNLEVKSLDRITDQELKSMLKDRGLESLTEDTEDE